MYLNEYKIKIENENVTNEYRYFIESNFADVNRLFVLIYSNADDMQKRYKSRRYYLLKGIIKSYSVIINEKYFYDQPIDPDIKRYEEIRKSTTGQGEDYITGCLLGYYYIKNHYILIAVDLSKQRELDADLKGLQQIKFVGQLKKIDGDGNITDAGPNQSMFVLTILEKFKET